MGFEQFNFFDETIKLPNDRPSRAGEEVEINELSYVKKTFSLHLELFCFDFIQSELRNWAKASSQYVILIQLFGDLSTVHIERISFYWYEILWECSWTTQNVLVHFLQAK